MFRDMFWRILYREVLFRGDGVQGHAVMGMVFRDMMLGVIVCREMLLRMVV